MMLIVEHKEKKTIAADIKGILAYTAYLFPESDESKAFSLELHQRGKAINFITITEAMNPVNSKEVSSLAEKMEKGELQVCHLSSIRFYDEARKPEIIPLGESKQDNLLESIDHVVSYNPRYCQHELCGLHRLEFYMLGANLDQFFYVHTNAQGIACLYKYNLLWGYLQEVDEWDSAKPESKGDEIKNHLLSTLSDPQIVLELDVKPYIRNEEN